MPNTMQHRWDGHNIIIRPPSPSFSNNSNQEVLDENGQRKLTAVATQSTNLSGAPGSGRGLRREISNPASARKRREALSRVQAFCPGMIPVDFEIDGNASSGLDSLKHRDEQRLPYTSVSRFGNDVQLIEPGRLASMLERPYE